MISAILLAAGQSKRMGEENKLVKKIQDIPLIKHSVKNILLSSVNKLIIVVGHQKEVIQEIIDESNKIKFIYNEDFASGMASSIKIGIKHLPENTEFFFICLGDMPMINAKIYNQLIKSKDKKEIIVPNYKNQQGNPVLFNKSMKDKIMSIKGDMGAKKLIESNQYKVLNVSINDENIIRNYNTQENFVDA